MMPRIVSKTASLYTYLLLLLSSSTLITNTATFTLVFSKRRHRSLAQISLSVQSSKMCFFKRKRANRNGASTSKKRKNRQENNKLQLIGIPPPLEKSLLTNIFLGLGHDLPGLIRSLDLSDQHKISSYVDAVQEGGSMAKLEGHLRYRRGQIGEANVLAMFEEVFMNAIPMSQELQAEIRSHIWKVYDSRLARLGIHLEGKV